MRKKRKEMTEEEWNEHQRQRNSKKDKLYRAKKTIHVGNWRRRTKQKLIEYKGGKCEMCGFDKDCSTCYDFHHIDPATKKFGIGGKGITRQYDKLIEEVDKCLLLCKNCHAELHDLEYKQKNDEAKIKCQKLLDEHNFKSDKKE